MLLQHYMIPATMTEEMLTWEKQSGIFGPNLIKKLHTVRYEELNGKVRMECIRDEDLKLNFEGGATSQYVAVMWCLKWIGRMLVSAI